MNKFTASFSGGKDSVFSIYNAINQGYSPISLITTYNTAKNSSWFHDIDLELLKQIASSMQIPLELINTDGTEYEKSFEEMLKVQRQKGAEYAVFGDIDIDNHLDWNIARCHSAQIKPLMPLFGKARKEVVYSFIDAGFKAMINIVDSRKMDEKFIGQTLSVELLQQLEAQGIDICGENGEYHTIVYDGPIFSFPVNLEITEKRSIGDRCVLRVRA